MMAAPDFSSEGFEMRTAFHNGRRDGVAWTPTILGTLIVLALLVVAGCADGDGTTPPVDSPTPPVTRSEERV